MAFKVHHYLYYFNFIVMMLLLCMNGMLLHTHIFYLCESTLYDHTLVLSSVNFYKILNILYYVYKIK